jgi:hypothetical protein
MLKKGTSEYSENKPRRHLRTFASIYPNNSVMTSEILLTDMRDNNNEVFVEKFTIESYTGIKGKIGRRVEDRVDGIKSASIKSDHSDAYVENHQVELEIKYDAIETDRTQICLIIEEFDSVGGKVMKS